MGAGAAVGEHRPLAEVIEQHHDRSRPATRSGHHIDPLRAELIEQGRTLWIVTDLTDEPSRVPGTHDADGHVRRAAPTPADHRGGGVARLVNGSGEVHHHVLDEIADGTDHGAAWPGRSRWGAERIPDGSG